MLSRIGNLLKCFNKQADRDETKKRKSRAVVKAKKSKPKNKFKYPTIMEMLEQAIKSRGFRRSDLNTLTNNGTGLLVTCIDTDPSKLTRSELASLMDDLGRRTIPPLDKYADLSDKIVAELGKVYVEKIMPELKELEKKAEAA